MNNLTKEEKFISKSPEETYKIAEDIVSKIKAPCLIGLSGDLGVGKTIFAKGIAENLNVQELITSPTFLGISEYYSGDKPFIHMDFYQKTVPIKIVKDFLNKPSIVLIEWFENLSEVKSLTPSVYVNIQYKNLNSEEESNERIITIMSNN